ncbi:hypothetical protein D3C78_1155020 [compost metagenome]
MSNQRKGMRVNGDSRDERESNDRGAYSLLGRTGHSGRIALYDYSVDSSFRANLLGQHNCMDTCCVVNDGNVFV